ncbi:hypothetical protein L3Y34_006828 [Caenorhabditis briggsae]|uniref:Uncharacterized protein n=1 Tax=Caenorhabditis briggsae TaxID=6238 RepID=A0AAE8ZXQ6_CAEBR|nr:hypothetical protein L3Y34_006828 [Caenorhabditis briggsae]
MSKPSSSEHSCPSLTITATKNCQVCGKLGHGKHFGAFTCRACAAFFRRFAQDNNFRPCEKYKICGLPKNGSFDCKSCRLKRCRNLGMTMDNFQFGRDPYVSTIAKTQNTIPTTVDIFLGKPSLIIYCARQSGSADHFKFNVDLHYLLEKAEKVLEKGPETITYSSNPLEKLSFGLRKICWPDTSTIKTVTKFARDETFALWEDEILKAAKWLTYFDDFQMLSMQLKTEIVKSVWNAFSRLVRMASAAMARKSEVWENNMLVTYIGDEFLVADYKKMVFDISWCSNYTHEQLEFFNNQDFQEECDDLIQAVINLDPTDVELSYMLSQLCFHQVAKKYPGAIQEIAEKFQETLSNHLHSYYVEILNNPIYSKRIACMMKINNLIEKCIYRDKVRSELKKVFDIYYVTYSPPDFIVQS